MDDVTENILYGALEHIWVLGIQFPDRQQSSLYRIKGGDTKGLMSKLTAARDRWAKELLFAQGIRGLVDHSPKASSMNALDLFVFLNSRTTKTEDGARRAL